MFATSHGSVRRNKLTDFQNIRSNGLIAMKLDEGESLVSVMICAESEDILLSTKMGKSIRFPVTDIRVFSGRTSTGVRGVKMKDKNDELISMSVLKHVDATPDERTAYLKAASALRGADEDGAEYEEGGDVALSEERFKELQDSEQFLLTASNGGFGKRTSAYEYRISGRGGMGVTNMSLTKKNGGEVIAIFPVTDDHQLMLISNQGQMIRMPVAGVRFTGRSAQGVTLFKVADGEKVVSVAWLVEDEDDDEAETEGVLEAGAENTEGNETSTDAAPVEGVKTEETAPEEPKED
jgi:DNA gyrase subunit A